LSSYGLIVLILLLQLEAVFFCHLSLLLNITVLVVHVMVALKQQNASPAAGKSYSTGRSS